jgi:hypothetical protein
MAYSPLLQDGLAIGTLAEDLFPLVSRIRRLYLHVDK